MNRGIVFLLCHRGDEEEVRPQGSACEVTGRHPEQNLIPAQRHTSLTDKEVGRVVRSCYTSKTFIVALGTRCMSRISHTKSTVKNTFKM